MPPFFTEVKHKYPPMIDSEDNYPNKRAKLGPRPWFHTSVVETETAEPRWKLERALLSMNSIIRVLGGINKARSLSEEATRDCYKASSALEGVRAGPFRIPTKRGSTFSPDWLNLAASAAFFAANVVSAISSCLRVALPDLTQ